MADPKYAGLEGIAYDEPDAYETADLPESDQTVDFFEDANETVERITISATDAFNKFRGKTIDGKCVDFSDRISTHLRCGYEINWQPAEPGQTETLIQKNERLQSELNDFAEELKTQKEKMKGDADISVTSEQIEAALKKLADMKLEETLGKDFVNSIADPQGAQLKNLFVQLENFKKSAVEQPEAQPPADGVTFQLNYRPEQIKLQQTERVADLEQRLHRLESVMGTKSDQLSRLATATGKGSLLEAAQHLAATASMLDSAQLDHIEGRLTALAQKMDTIAKKKEELANDEEKDKMILELYELVKNSESFSKVLPATVDRLQALEQLHNKASQFASTLTQIEVLQSEIQGHVENNKALLKGVQDSFSANLEEINKTAIGLDSRIKALKKN